MSGVVVEGALELAEAWDASADGADDELRPVVSKGALNIRTDWRERSSGFRHVPNIPYTITYDLDTTETDISAEIGPDKEKVVGGGPFRTPGHLGAILEFGSINNAPHPGGQPALDAEAPRFEQAAGDAAERLADV